MKLLCSFSSDLSMDAAWHACRPKSSKLELSYLEHIHADVQPGIGRFRGLLCALYVTFMCLVCYFYVPCMLLLCALYVTFMCLVCYF